MCLVPEQLPQRPLLEVIFKPANGRWCFSARLCRRERSICLACLRNPSSITLRSHSCRCSSSNDVWGGQIICISPVRQWERNLSFVPSVSDSLKRGASMRKCRSMSFRSIFLWLFLSESRKRSKACLTSSVEVYGGVVTRIPADCGRNMIWRAWEFIRMRIVPNSLSVNSFSFSISLQR